MPGEIILIISLFFLGKMFNEFKMFRFQIDPLKTLVLHVFLIFSIDLLIETEAS